MLIPCFANVKAVTRGFVTIHLVLYVPFQTAEPLEYSNLNVQKAIRGGEDTHLLRSSRWSASPPPLESRTLSHNTPSSIFVECYENNPTITYETIKSISPTNEIFQPGAALSTELAHVPEDKGLGLNPSFELSLDVHHFNALLDSFFDQAIRGKATFDDCDFLIRQVA